MKTSNKVIFGFLLAAIMVQTTLMVIAHNVSQDRPPVAATILQEVELTDSFTTLHLHINGHVNITESQKNQLVIKTYDENASKNYQIDIKNDTCFVYSEAKEYVTLDINTNKMRQLIIDQASSLDIRGKYDSLWVHNHKSRLSIQHKDTRINFLQLTATERSNNNLQNIGALDLSLDHSSLNGSNINNLTSDIRNNSDLNIEGLPNINGLKKDDNSKINFH
ncbi:hypothetical protein GCM10007049_25220 [Echinicola pacifica]|uniref:Uncharacterized protein n=1 Tax=Echinicola pacifica TaxID=346377 RepID=A0A918US29_9BACT|nr:hypothetical protein [Echinicola pacifica]GGZ31182.1 hypothetical protein GCM10007049_25220 [Echinicola pacifica]